MISKTILIASAASFARWTMIPFLSALPINCSRYSSRCSITSARTACACWRRSRQSGREANAAIRPVTRRSALASNALCSVSFAREARIRSRNSARLIIHFAGFVPMYKPRPSRPSLSWMTFNFVALNASIYSWCVNNPNSWISTLCSIPFDVPIRY